MLSDIQLMAAHAEKGGWINSIRDKKTMFPRSGGFLDISVVTGMKGFVLADRPPDQEQLPVQPPEQIFRSSERPNNVQEVEWLSVAVLDIKDGKQNKIGDMVVRLDKGIAGMRCPWCEGSVIVPPSDMNCGIFRHGVYKATGEPIGAHAGQEECEKLYASGAILGCGKPFKVEGDRVLKCGWI